MIKTIEDLRFYLQEDKKRYSLPCHWYLGMLLGIERCHSYRLVRYLRKYEYTLNTSKSFISRIFLLWRKFRFKRLCYKYKIFLSPNTIGYGFRIIHFGGGVIVNCKKMGNYCGVTTGVVIGNKDSQEARPTIGDNCSFTLGCKVIGNITIGNNVTVAPNSVVVKDVSDNAIVTGIPAHVLKYKS